MPLGRARAPFTHRDWVFEIKWDGFRCLAFIENGKCKLVSRNGNEFKSFPDLTVTLPEELGNRTAILDGEIVCLNTHGKAEFGDLLFRRREPRFIAFDLLSSRGEDLRYMSLIDRKRRLRALIRPHGERLLYCDHVEHNGEALLIWLASMIWKA
jgi:bifunctional non-homologous end joining protein LigD